MQDELITTENVSPEMVKAALDQAYMNAVIDKDGSIMIQEQFKIWLNFDKSGRYIQLRTAFRIKDGASRSALLDYANGINYDLIVLRTYLGETSVVMDHYVWLEGGITRKNLIMSVKMFFSIVDAALDKASDDLL